MALSLVNNATSINAQHSLTRSNNALTKSLERLSTGLKINRGADDPAGLVISEQQRAQITGLRTAIDNVSKGVNVIQTAEGALDEINKLLLKARSLALDSSNTAVHDANSLAANQAEIDNIVDTISRIASNTRFGTKHLLQGDAVDVAVSGANNSRITSLSKTAATKAGIYEVEITTQGTGGNVTGATSNQQTIAAAGGQLTITGSTLTSAVEVQLAAGDNVDDVAARIQTALNSADAQGGGAGRFTVQVDGGQISIRSNVLGSGAITVVASNTTTAGVTGFATGAGTTGAAGANIVATINGAAATVQAGANGQNNQLTLSSSGNDANGLTVVLDVTNGQTAAASSTQVTVGEGFIFQIGANHGETASIGIQDVRAFQLGTNVAGLNNAATSNLSQIRVDTFDNAQDALKVIDKAIDEITTLRGKLGAFQRNTLEATGSNLRQTLENTVQAESTIRDTDFAQETAEFTKQQVLVQSGITVLQNANQLSQLVLGLLRG